MPAISPWYGCTAATCERCNLPDAVAACSPTGECVVESRTFAFDCDGVAANGCESHVSAQHCGGCGIACPAGLPHTKGSRCVGSGPACEVDCEAGYTNADGDMSNGCEGARFFTSDAGCPGIMPKSEDLCEQISLNRTCRYKHPEVACTQTMECVYPLSVSLLPRWILVGDPCL